VCLGYRGLIARQIKTDEGSWDKAVSTRRVPLPNEFRVGVKTAKRDSATDWLVNTAKRQGVRLVDEVQEVVSRGVVVVPATRGPSDPAVRIDHRRVERADVAVDAPLKPGTEPHETWWACGSNGFYPNAGFFNDPAHVTRNNCYCFASNHRPDIRGAYPGRRGGRPATAITCGALVDGLRADGLERRLPARRVLDNCDGVLAIPGLPLLTPGDRRSILVVGAQAWRHAGQIHRRLRACNLPVSR
jgi:hypothetical protein